MIHYLKGKIEERGNDYIVIETGGVGYFVFVSGLFLKELEKQADNKEEIKIYTYQKVGEGILDLYGFLRKKDLEMFNLLLLVSGIGPKSALNILSKANIEDIQKAVVSQDLNHLTERCGIGKKTAERIIMDLKGKIKDEEFGEDYKHLSEDNRYSLRSSEVEVVDALVKLGYSRNEALNVLKKMPDDIKDISRRVKWALKNI